MVRLEAGDFFFPAETFGQHFGKVLLNIRDNTISGAEKKALLVLSELTTDEGLCCVSAHTIAKHANINPKTANKVTVTLTKKGFLTTKKGKGIPNTYFFMWKDIYGKAATVPVYDYGEGKLVSKTLQNINKHKHKAKVSIIAKEKLLTEIKSHYHPEHINQQPIRAKQELSDMLDSTVSGLNDPEKIEYALEAKRKQIIDFIERLKTSSVWNNNGGKFLMGLGNFMAARGWEVKVEKTIENQLAELIEGAP